MALVRAACVDPVAELGAPKETSICVMAAAWDANSAATNAAAQISELNSKVEITPMIGGEHRGKRCQYRGVPALGRSGGAFRAIDGQRRAPFDVVGRP